MSWRLFNKLSAVTLSSLGGFSLYSYLSPDSKLKTVFANQWIVNTKPSTDWDPNWDHRAATSIVQPLTDGSNSEKKKSHDEKIDKNTSKAIRHIILIRHGQYNLNGTTDNERILTDLGREQAKLTGQRLADLKIPIDDIVVSTMTRAQETGNLILEKLPHREIIKVENEPLIEEGAPIAPSKINVLVRDELSEKLFFTVPDVAHWNPDPWEFFQEGSRIEAGFRTHIHRAVPSQENESYSLMVCHGNVIRYFVCRALQFPPEAWLRFNIHHASITWLVLYPNGRVVLRLFGDCGHMPKTHVTLS